MKRLIKSGEAHSPSLIRPLDGPASITPEAPQPDPLLLAAHARIAELEAALAEQRKRVDAMPIEIDNAFKRGHAEGCSLGKQEAARLERERLAQLVGAIGAARDQLEGALAGVERLALLVVRDCLDMLLGDPLYRPEVLAGLIRHQIEQMGEDIVVDIRVAEADFPDPDAIVDLRMAAGKHIALTVDPSMLAGDCTMTLSLGKAEIGLGQQWGAMRALLSDMADATRP